jgi:hypothetical protein
MQNSYFYGDGIFDVVPRWDIYNSALWDYVEK